jgi:hypothetical protein
MMEYWNDEKMNFTHYSSIPLLHYSSVISFQFFFQLALPIEVSINSPFGKKALVVPDLDHLSFV